MSDTRVEFLIGNATLRSKLIDGTYPEYERVIPSEADSFVNLPATALSAALAQMKALATGPSFPVRLGVSATGCSVSFASPETGVCSAPLAGQGYDGAGREAGFQGRYLLDFCKHMQTDMQVMLSDHFGAGPSVMRDPADPRATFVLMPVRL